MIMTLYVLVVLAMLLHGGLQVERGERCTNRKGEVATCTNIHSCKAAIDAMTKANGADIYATGQICGFDTETLVCCQTMSDFTKTNENSTVSNETTTDLDIFTNLIALTKAVEVKVEPLESNDITALPLSISSSVSNAIPDSTTSSPTEAAVLARKTTNPVKELLPDRYTCGVQSQKGQFEASHVAGIDEFPWVALLKYQDGFGYDAGFRCTGTLINEEYIVTAAHCVVTDPELLYINGVRLGEWVISSHNDCVLHYHGEECAERVVDLGIKKKIPHPQYDPNCDKNDIALIRMDKKVTYSAFIRPICLPVQNLSAPSPGDLLTTSGWGTTKYGFFLDIKSKVQASVLNNYDCLNPIWGYKRIFEDQVCIAKADPHDLCTADSGGPLMAIDKDDKSEKSQWYLEGVMSAGYGCEKQDYYGVYTRVTKHVEWILSVLSNED